MSTRKSKIARRVAILVSWSIAFGCSLIALFAGAPQIVIIALFLGGVLPYIVSIQVIEPWLEKREEE
jgi:hypothetical protein